MGIGDNIRYYRKKAGLKLCDMASKLNMNTSLLSRYELGNLRVSADTMREIAKTLNITEQDLFAEIPLTLGEKIAKARRNKKLTQQQLADGIWKAESSIRKYEKGSVEIPISVIKQIAEKLEVEFNYLIGEKVEEKVTGTEREESSLVYMSIFDLHVLITNASAELARRATEKAPTDASQ